MDVEGHDPSLFVSVRLGGSPIAGDLEKYTEVFTEDVEWWWMDSIGYGRTRPVSVFVVSTEQSPIARDLEKYTELFTEDVKCSQSYSIGQGTSFRMST